MGSESHLARHQRKDRPAIKEIKLHIQSETMRDARDEEGRPIELDDAGVSAPRPVQKSEPQPDFPSGTTDNMLRTTLPEEPEVQFYSEAKHPQLIVDTLPPFYGDEIRTMVAIANVMNVFPLTQDEAQRIAAWFKKRWGI